MLSLAARRPIDGARSLPLLFGLVLQSRGSHKEDIRVIQVLLGHKKLETTALYAQVATRTLSAVTSPLDRLTPEDPPRT
ncbi:hypothetical protein CKO41_10250 [Thiococcus pfennigii]|nr:hypothetical protein [Thiococcus pfennigii]